MHNQEAILVNPHCPEEFTRAIHLLSTDDALRSRLGANAKTKAGQYDESIVFPRIVRYYKFIYTEIKKRA